MEAEERRVVAELLEGRVCAAMLPPLVAAAVVFLIASPAAECSRSRSSESDSHEVSSRRCQSSESDSHEGCGRRPGRLPWPSFPLWPLFPHLWPRPVPPRPPPPPRPTPGPPAPTTTTPAPGTPPPATTEEPRGDNG